MRIGVLDDNPAIGEYLHTALTLAGHSVTVYHTASCLFEALFPDGIALLPLPYDCLLLDIFLPGDLSGIQVARHIQQQMAPAEILIILMTASSPATINPLLSEVPGIPILYKPFHLAQLSQLLALYKPTG